MPTNHSPNPAALTRTASPMVTIRDPREPALEQLLFSMRRALVERRQVIEIGDLKFRFQRRGEEFEHGDFVLKTLESGVLVCFPQHNSIGSATGRWLHLGSTDDLEDLMAPYIKHLDARQCEELRAGISAEAALQAIANEQRSAACQVPEASPTLPVTQSLAAQVPAEFATKVYESNAVPPDALQTRRRPKP